MSRTPVSTTPPTRALPSDVRHDRLVVGGIELHVVSHALPSAADGAPSPLSQLSPALREIARLVLIGLDNAAIASARGTSQRTVAKQLEGLYRRLGVGSRIELVARFSTPETPAR